MSIRWKRATAAIVMLLLASLLASCSSTVPHGHDYLREHGGWCDACERGFCDGREFDERCCYDARALYGEPCPEHDD